MDLDRFKRAQEYYYNVAINEISNGHKTSHWIWFIFPQLDSLGESINSEYYGIHGIYEAEFYINDELLKNRLIEITNALLNNSGNILDIVGFPDNYKIQSCMTLFEYVAPEIECFGKVLDKFYDGVRDLHTIEILNFEKCVKKIKRS